MSYFHKVHKGGGGGKPLQNDVFNMHCLATIYEKAPETSQPTVF